VPWLYQPLFAWAPALGEPGVKPLLVAATVVALMVWVVMPRYTRLVAKWLFN